VVLPDLSDSYKDTVKDIRVIVKSFRYDRKWYLTYDFNCWKKIFLKNLISIFFY
jgi:hypothetical protein